MVKVLQNYSPPLHEELKAFLILLAHTATWLGQGLSPDKPWQRSVGISSRRDKSWEGDKLLMSEKTDSSHRDCHPFYALGITCHKFVLLSRWHFR